MIFNTLPTGTAISGKPIPGFKTSIDAAQYIYLIAGVHGDEIEGIHVLEKLFAWLKTTDEVLLPIVVIPILNVDGHQQGTRVNARGVDLNRNLPAASWSPVARAPQYHPGTAPLSEPENQFLVALLDKFPPNIIISFHSWDPMLNYNGNCKHVADFISTYNHYPVVGEIANHATPGSLGDFGPQQYNASVLTYECPYISTELTLETIWQQNCEGLQQLLRSTLLTCQ